MPFKNNELYEYLKTKLLQNNQRIKLIETELRQSNKKIQKQNFVFKTTKQPEYVIYNLPEAKEEIAARDETFALQEHHISFYSQQKKDDPFLGEYHYTAYFIGKSGKKYRLHVYLNQKDGVEAIQLSQLVHRESGEDTWVVQKVLEADLSNDLIQLAVDKTRDFMIELRCQYQAVFNALEASYIKYEAKLSHLSEDLNSNRDEYIRQLNETIEILKLLSPHRQQYIPLLTLFNRIKRSMESAPVARQDFECMDPVEVKDDSDVAVKEITQETPTSQRSLVKSIQELVNDAKCAKENFLKIKSEKKPYVDQIRPFLNFDESVKEALVLTEQHNLRIVLRLLSECKIEAITLLSGLFSEEKFEEALQLREYINLLSHKLIAKALEKKNASLLEFLLKNCDFPINTMQVDGKLPVLHCFEKNYVDCLAVLIKYGASIVIDAGDGLPIAYHILRSLGHPLRVALDQNYKITCGSPSFAYALCSFIINSFANCPDPSKNNALLAANQEINDETSFIRKQIKSSRNRFLSERRHMIASQFFNNQGDDTCAVLKTLMESKEFKDRNKKCTEEMHNYHSRRLRRHNKRQIAAKEHKYDKELNEHMRGSGMSLFRDPEELKGQVFKYLDDLTEMYKLNAELASNKPGKKNVRKRAAIKNELKLLEERSPSLSLSKWEKIKSTHEKMQREEDTTVKLLKKIGADDALENLSEIYRQFQKMSPAERGSVLSKIDSELHQYGDMQSAQDAKFEADSLMRSSRVRTSSTNNAVTTQLQQVDSAASPHRRKK